MSLLLPLNEQTPETDSDFVFFYSAMISADVVGRVTGGALVACDVTMREDSAALIAADVEGSEGGAVAIIDLVNENLR